MKNAKNRKHDEGHLMKLPGEVRNLIYKDLISRRDLSLMGTNLLIYQEMQGLVLRSIPYRLYVNYPEEARYPRRVPDGKIGEGIHNVEIYWRPVEQLEQLELDDAPRASFGRSLEAGVPRKRCVLYFERVSIGWTSWIREQDLSALASLRGFDCVVIRVLTKARRRLKYFMFMAPLYLLWKGMEGVLGVAGSRGWDDDGAYIEFHVGPGWKRMERIRGDEREKWRMMNHDAESEEGIDVDEFFDFIDGVEQQMTDEEEDEEDEFLHRWMRDGTEELLAE